MAFYPGTGGGRRRGGGRKKSRNPFAGMPPPRRGVQGAATFYGRGLFGGVQPQASGGGGGYSGLVGDYLNQARSDFAAASGADAASRDAALRKFIISYGAVPDFNQLGISASARGFLEKALDQKTRDLALKNYAEGTAIKARMDKANEVAQRRIPAQLAARGLLHSGQTGVDLAEQAQNYKIQGFDTLNEMLGGIEGTVGNFLENERQRQRELAEAAMRAAEGAYGDFGDSYLGDGYGGSQGLVYKPPRFTGPGTRRRGGVNKKFLRRLGRYPGIRRSPTILGGRSAI
ncbi:MAG: hypothetical protein L0191_05865 [Acidobacteria bacterium]|nr:hypothetical protein [Acidobacteriota bacterium]